MMDGTPPSPFSMPSGCPLTALLVTSHVPRSRIAAKSSNSHSLPCSIVSTPASMQIRTPGPPWAWTATGLLLRCASSTTTWTSWGE